MEFSKMNTSKYDTDSVTDKDNTDKRLPSTTMRHCTPFMLGQLLLENLILNFSVVLKVNIFKKSQ